MNIGLTYVNKKFVSNEFKFQFMIPQKYISKKENLTFMLTGTVTTQKLNVFICYRGT